MKPAKPAAKAASKTVKEATEPVIDGKVEVVDDKAGKKMQLAIMKGASEADAVVTDTISNFKHLIPKKFVSSPTGLVLADGSSDPTAEELGRAVSGFTQLYDGIDRMKNSCSWNLGDAVNMGEKIGYGVEQAVSDSGKARHTINNIANVAAWLPYDRRRGELSFTHHQEAFNYSKVEDDKGKRKLTDAKLFGFLDKAVKGEKIVDIDTVSGEKRELWKPVSCATLREWLQEACGIEKKSKEKKEKSETGEGDSESEVVVQESKGFLFIDADFEVFKGDVMSDAAVDPAVFLVINLDTGECFPAGERVPMEVKPLPEKYQVPDLVVATPFDPPSKPVKEKKPKKEKAVKVKVEEPVALSTEGSNLPD